MEEDNKNAYSEVIEILKLIDDEEKLEALPIEMLEVLKANCNPEYKPQISLEIPLEEQELQNETYRILSWIAAKYWNENVDELQKENFENIEELKQENIKNDVQENIDEKAKDTINEVKEQSEINNQNTNTTVLPILHKDLKWYQKIKMRIIEIFNKIFKKNKNSANEEKGTA